MNPTPTIPIDIVNVLAALFAGIFGVVVGHQVAVYVTIVFASFGGALFAQSRRPKESPMSGWLFIFLMTGIFVLCGASLAELLSSFINKPATIIVGPLCAVGAGVGHEWPDLIRAGIKRLADVFWPNRNGGQP